MTAESEGEFVSAIEQDVAQDIAEEADASIWGQKSDLDVLAPATTVGEYDEMLAEDADVDCVADEASSEEDVSDLELE